MPAGVAAGLLRGGPGGPVRQLRQLRRGVYPGGRDRPRPDDSVLRPPGAGEAGLLRGQDADRPHPPRQPGPAGAGAGAGRTVHLRPDEQARRLPHPGDHGLFGAGGLSAPQPGPLHPGAGGGGPGGALPGEAAVHVRPEGPGGGAGKGEAPDARPGRRGPGGADSRPQGGAEPPGPAGGRARLHRVFQRHPHRYGGQAPPDHGGPAGGLRCGPGEGGEVRRGLFGGYRPV